jgi:hypothetical protein
MSTEAEKARVQLDDKKPQTHYCDGVNSRGYRCGNKVSEGVRFCSTHAKLWYARKRDSK